MTVPPLSTGWAVTPRYPPRGWDDCPGMQRGSGHCWLCVVVETFDWLGAVASSWKAATPMAARPPATTTAETAARAMECGKWCCGAVVVLMVGPLVVVVFDRLSHEPRSKTAPTTSGKFLHLPDLRPDSTDDRDG